MYVLTSQPVFTSECMSTLTSVYNLAKVDYVRFWDTGSYHVFLDVLELNG